MNKKFVLLSSKLWDKKQRTTYIRRIAIGLLYYYERKSGGRDSFEHLSLFSSPVILQLQMPPSINASTATSRGSWVQWLKTIYD